MKRGAGTALPQVDLPAGYSIQPFQAGDERQWAEIEASVGEFEDSQEALRYFRQTYLPHLDELQQRLLFVRDPDGDPVGTITAWWNFTCDRRDGAIHWLAVKQAHQGRGLAKALVASCLQKLYQLEGTADIYVHTQTWSHRAIGIYQKAGFEILKRETFGGYPNEYDQALPILKQFPYCRTDCV